MPKMVPVDGLRPGVGGAAHDRLRSALERALPGDAMVVHGARWVGQSLRHGACDGACDFLVCDPDRGVLLLQVFVGGLRHDPARGQWQTGRGGHIDDPFETLEAQAEALRRLLDAQPTALPARPVVGCGVVTPDIIAPHSGFAAHAPRETVIDLRDLDSLTDAIDRVFRHWEERSPAVGNASNRWWLRVLERLFVAPVQVRARLGARLDADRKQMLALDAQQIAVLDMLARLRQVTVYGPAGTGKTVLAIAKAHALAEQGLRVLLTCYNKALGFHLRRVCADQPSIVAAHFHELCYQLLGLHQQPRARFADPGDRRHYFDEQLPASVIAAAHRLPKFDAVVVDEGQDYQASYWRALEAISADGPGAIRYIFYDDRQQIRLRPGIEAPSVPGAETAIVLRTNWRNTRRIHGHISHFEPPFRDTPCAAPEGVPVWHVPIEGDGEGTLRRVLRRLVVDEGVVPADIAILTGRARDKSSLKRIDGPIPVSELVPGVAATGATISTIHAFKGLESPVVILAELDHVPEEARRRLHYVGASRAMSLLVVLSNAEIAEAR